MPPTEPIGSTTTPSPSQGAADTRAELYKLSDPDPKQPPVPHGGESAERHRHSAPRVLAIAVITVSDTRDATTDTGGDLLAEGLAAAGHRVVARRWVADDRVAIRVALDALLDDPSVQVILLTGGSGLAPRDVTPEALAGLFEREIPGFGELFRMLSYEEIGAAAMLSRAAAGVAKGRIIAALPGSRAALRLALERLLIPELGHLYAEANKETRRVDG